MPVALLALDQGWGIEGVWWGLAGLIVVRALTCGVRFAGSGGFSPALRRSTLRARMLRRPLIIAFVLALLLPAAAGAQQAGPAGPAGGGGAQQLPPEVQQQLQQQQQQQQGGGSPTDPFSPLPAPAPTAAPTTEQSSDDPLADDLGGTTTLYVIMGALLVVFIGVGMFISRDARRSMPKRTAAERSRQRDQGPHKHERRAKEKARERSKRQRAARRRNRA